MTSDKEKDPPVPADLEGAAKRVHRVQVPDESGHDAPEGEPND